MAVILHEMAVSKTAGAFPQFKWLAHCNGCGFEARAPHPLLLVDAAKRHLGNQGASADVTKKLDDDINKAEEEDKKDMEEQKQAEEKAKADAEKAAKEQSQPAPQTPQTANPVPINEEGHPPASKGKKGGGGD
jgi:hypothetical protein